MLHKQKNINNNKNHSWTKNIINIFLLTLKMLNGDLQFFNDNLRILILIFDISQWASVSNTFRTVFSPHHTFNMLSSGNGKIWCKNSLDFKNHNFGQMEISREKSFFNNEIRLKIHLNLFFLAFPKNMFYVCLHWYIEKCTVFMESS